MRIRFAARQDEDEWEALEALRRGVDAFWLECTERVARAGTTCSDVVVRRRLEQELTAAARRAAPGLGVELDALDGGECRVVIAPASDTGGGPLVDEFLTRAPRSGKLVAVRFRPEVDVATALVDVQARLGVDLERARVRMGFSRGHLLEAVVYAPSFAHAADERGHAAAELLLSRLLGEGLLHDFVGSIDVAPLPRGGSLRVVSDGATSAEATLPLAEVLPAAEAAIRGLYAELPEAPYHTFCERAEWTMLELEPSIAEDYGAKDDLALVSTMLPEATKCYLQGAPFSSVRFSKHGERFAYLKLDTTDRTPNERHSLRVELEDSLNGLLVPGGVGCVTGAGLGVRYVYLDLALQNLEHGVRIACDRVRKVLPDIPAWALFCETGWEKEWVGVGQYGPPPSAPRLAQS
ncbi:MAG TPA: hypothetical protein VH062_22280 [Polyangiaceae bacterium]|jgi:hypothetical protein|nr:hypothetical protein [Polyangiaceae bacterium]